MSLSSYLTSIDTYKETKKFRLKVLKADINAINEVLSTVSEILRNKNSAPIQQFLAVKFCKDTIEVFNDSFISQFQTVCLPLIEKIAQFECNNPDPQRGRRMFDDPQVGNSLLTLVLECIFVWSKWFPVDPSTNQLSCYKIAYEKLIRLGMNSKLQSPFIGVKFEQVSVYFDFDIIMKHVPETSVPRLMLKESTDLIKAELIQKKNSGCKQIADQLTVTVKMVTKLDEPDQLYQNIWNRLMKKALGKMRREYVPRPITLSYFGKSKNSNNLQLKELERQNSDLMSTIRSQQLELDQLKQELFMIKSVRNDSQRQPIFKPTAQLLQQRESRNPQQQPVTQTSKIFDSNTYTPYIPYQTRRQQTIQNSKQSPSLKYLLGQQMNTSRSPQPQIQRVLSSQRFQPQR